MNDSRKVRLLAALALITSAADILKELGDEEQLAFDNLPQGLKDAEAGDNILSSITALNNTVSALEDAQEYINDTLS